MTKFACGLLTFSIIAMVALIIFIPTPFEPRKIGDSIEGYWYYPDLIDGCFQSLPVVQYTVDKIQVIINSNKKVVLRESLINELKIQNGQVKKHLTNTREIKGRTVLVHEFTEYQDNGYLLHINKSHGMIEGKKLKLTGATLIRHCSSPTFLGKMKLAFGLEKSFNPNIFK